MYKGKENEEAIINNIFFVNGGDNSECTNYVEA